MEHKLHKAHPKHQEGRLHSIKNATSVILQLLLFVTPWINWGGRQMILLDLPGRKLHLFHWTFWPQETLFVLLMLFVVALAVAFVTSVLGRLWCGYACPQTIFSHAFIYVERMVEGDRFKRMRLDKAPWNKDKITKKLVKWSIWLGMSVYLGFTFAGYYTPIRSLFANFISGKTDQGTLLTVGFFTVVSMFFFGFLRGRFCSTMCPYARFQGAMFDRDTLMVTYDYPRGEPKGKAKDPNAGDCVDCTLCVQVCPQNIDIRDGVQFECINCGACADACDSVMENLNRDLGLIRYASENEIEGGKTNWFRPRPAFYGVAALGALVVFLGLLFNRVPLELDVVREAKGGAFSQAADGRISNQYNIRLINKEKPAREVRLSLSGFDQAELFVPVNPVPLEAESSQVVKVFVLVEGEKVGPVHRFDFVAIDVEEEDMQKRVETTFLRGNK